MKIYISGAITGVKNYRHNFKVAEIAMQYAGHEVINPCDLPHEHNQSYEEFMTEDLKALLECDTILMLKGWEESRGATLEYNVAGMCGLEVLFL